MAPLVLLEQARRSYHEIESRWGPSVADRFGDIHSRYLSLGQTAGKHTWNLDREAELAELERTLPSSPAVFAHNDALAGNIMLDESTGQVTLIDFEYGGCNFRGFDIANHWNEWAGGTQAEMNGRCEYERFPSPEQQTAFAENYLKQDMLMKAEDMMKTGLLRKEEDSGPHGEHAFLESVVSAAIDESAVQALVEEANSYVLVNH